MLKFIQGIVTLTKTSKIRNVLPGSDPTDVVTVEQLSQYVDINKPCKIYKALISQSGTDAPTAIVIANTIGNIVWTRGNTGSYSGTLAGAFTENKTFCLPGCQDGTAIIVGIERENSDVIALSSIDVATVLGSDSLLYLTPILIEVYN